ncbi:MAG: undecaprenyl-diphosphate phosphatase [Phycisphaeraceae bacterium]|nr:undecaprenyl-diphosphate phosphatase [Phycisphaeraceae bacterium]
MNWWQAMILGIVEGLTEYLPVSSTGHLVVVQQLLGIGTASAEAKRAADAYAICIQGGAILAVAGLYYQRLRQMAAGVLGKSPAGLRMVINLAAGFFPAAVIGLAIKDLVKAHLFGPWPIIAAWFVGGVAILVVIRMRAQAHEVGGNLRKEGVDLEALTWRMGLVIGFAQCLAMWPGVSRSLITIVGGLLVGLNLAAAVEFSFLLGVITLTAATLLDAKEDGAVMVQQYGVQTMLIGAVAALVSAVLAVRWMVTYLRQHSLAIFGWYRIALAVVVAVVVVKMGMGK